MRNRCGGRYHSLVRTSRCVRAMSVLQVGAVTVPIRGESIPVIRVVHKKALLFYVASTEMCRGSHCTRQPFFILGRRRMGAALGKRHHGTFNTSRIQRGPSHRLVQPSPGANRHLCGRDHRRGYCSVDAQGDLSLYSSPWNPEGAGCLCRSTLALLRKRGVVGQEQRGKRRWHGRVMADRGES